MHFCDFLKIVLFISYFYDFLPIATISHLWLFLAVAALYLTFVTFSHNNFCNYFKFYCNYFKFVTTLQSP